MSVYLYLSHNLRKILQHTSLGSLSSPFSLLSAPIFHFPIRFSRFPGAPCWPDSAGLLPCPDPCCSICSAASMQLTFALSESYTHRYSAPLWVCFIFPIFPFFLFFRIYFSPFLYFCMHYSGVGRASMAWVDGTVVWPASVGVSCVLSPASFLAGWRRQSPPADIHTAHQIIYICMDAYLCEFSVHNLNSI